MEIIFLVGLSIFLGTLSGKFCARFKIPQVTGYILVGLLLGRSSLGLWTPSLIEAFAPFVDLALGIIGFLIGSELKFDLFRKRGRSIYSILICEGIVTFLMVAAAVTLLTGKLYYGILFGALASATDPTATANVLWENKSRGPLTTTLLAIVALDDVLALLLYGFSNAFAKSLITKEHLSFLHSVETPFIEIGMSVIIGIIGAYVFRRLIQWIKDKERVLPFALGLIALTVGTARYFNVDLILSSMILGFTLTNIAPTESAEIFSSIKKIREPVYILFFILVGVRLDLSLFLKTQVIFLVATYVFFRSFGKVSGAVLGGFVGKAQEKVTKFLGLGLFSQAGIAIGLAISIYQNLSPLGPEAAQVGLMVINVAVATTFLVQLVGPACVRIAAQKAGETGRDVTEDDIIESYRVRDLIEKNVPIIKEDTHLHELVGMVKESESDHFCVVDHRGRLLGSISIGDLRDVLLAQELEWNNLILAKDIAVPPAKTIADTRPLKEAIEILRRRDLDFLPVVKDETSKEFVGLIHYRHIISQIQKELLERRGTG